MSDRTVQIPRRFSRQHPLRYTMPIVPKVWWKVMGRKEFGRHSPRILNMLKVGDYGFPIPTTRR